MSEVPGATPDAAPTLYEWAGGLEALTRLTTHFYSAVVPNDEVLAPVFAAMPADHAQHVAFFLAEVLGGPSRYSREVAGERGGHAHMVAHHLERRLTEQQRSRWVQQLLSSADAVGLPDDPEFRSAFVAYLEWGSRIAVINSAPGVPDPTPAPMPRWGWGVPGGPYRPPAARETLSDVHVRRALKPDAAEVARLALEVQALHVAGRPDIFKPGGGELANEIADRIGSAGQLYWVATLADQAIGYAYARVIDEPDSRWRFSARMVILDQMGVDARYRSRGVGERLWNAVREAAIAEGAERVILNVWSFNRDARRFYERLGFAPFHERMAVELDEPRGDAR
jgi:hemoglobin